MWGEKQEIPTTISIMTNYNIEEIPDPPKKNPIIEAQKWARRKVLEAVWKRRASVLRKFQKKKNGSQTRRG